MNGCPVLTPRLMAAASLVTPGAAVADIGTDHALLPAYLTAAGICPRAVASDLRPGPLSRARETVERFGLSDKVKLALSDGLDGISPDDASEIILCGMGGELMADILSRAGWVRDGRHALILQPMTSIEKLRAWLFQNGFTAERETLAAEGEHIYYAMRMVPGDAGYCEPHELYFGRALIRDPLGREYLRCLIRRFEHIADAAGASRRAPDRERVREAKRILRGLRSLRDGWEDADVL